MENYTLDKENMGLRIRTARERKGWTREELAEKVGVSVNSMACVELGKNGMRLDNFRKLCSLLSLNADYVLFGETGGTVKEISALLRDRDEKTLRIVENTIRAMLEAMDGN